MNKRGISAVVATVLIILLVLVSVSVVWVGVRPLISGTSEQITAECLTLNIEPITCSTNQQGETTVRVRRNAGQGSLTEIRFLFDREENPISLTKSANINELETRTFMFNNSEVSNPEFIEIAAVLEGSVCNPVPRKISCRQENPNQPLGIIWPPPQLSPGKTWSYAWSQNTLQSLDNVVIAKEISTLSQGNQISQIVNATNAMPEGHVAILPREFTYANTIGNQISIQNDPEDDCQDENRNLRYEIDPVTLENRTFKCIWWDNGVQKGRQGFENFIQQYKNAGGRDIDVVVLDTEKYLSHWGMFNEYDSQIYGPGLFNPALELNWQMIEEDPRFEEEIKQELINRGYTPSTATLAETVWQWGPNAPQGSYDNYLVYNSLMLERAAKYINETTYDIFKNHYPNIIVSDYNFHYWNPAYSVPNSNGHWNHRYGKGEIVGNRQSQNLYPVIQQLANTGEPYWQQTPYNGFRYSVNKMRAMYLSAPESPIWPHVAHKDWDGGRIPPNLLRNVDLYQEHLIHAGMTNTEVFFYFNPNSPDQDDILFSNVLKEIDLMTNYPRKIFLTTSLTPWEEDFVYTGVQVGDVKVWRFTPLLNLTIGEIATDKLISENPLTFKVSRKSIEFPEGEIYIPNNPVSDQGLWILQPSTAPNPRIF